MTQYIIIGEKENIEKLYNHIKSFDANDSSDISLCDLIKDIEQYTSIDSRGYIYHYELFDTTLELFVESKWNGKHDVFELLNKKLCNNKLTINYKCSESGNEIFDIYNPSKVFPNNLCYFDNVGFLTSIDEGIHDMDIDDALNFWYNEVKDNIPNDWSSKMSIDQKIDMVNNFLYPDDKYVVLYKYNYIDEI